MIDNKLLWHMVCEALARSSEWCDYAASGDKINAIKSFRATIGCKLLEAKMAVELWMEHQKQFDVAETYTFDRGDNGFIRVVKHNDGRVTVERTFINMTEFLSTVI